MPDVMRDNWYQWLEQLMTVYNCDKYSEMDLRILEGYLQLFPSNDILDIIEKTRNEGGSCILHKAVRRNHPKIVKLVLEYLTEDVCSVAKMQSQNRHTILHIAAWEGRITIITCILSAIQEEHRLEVMSIRDRGGCTALVKAALEGHLEAIKCMLKLLPPRERLTVLKIPNNWGDTVMHNVARKGHTQNFESIRSFLPLKFQQQLYSIRNHDGETALDIAHEYRKKGTSVVMEKENSAALAARVKLMEQLLKDKEDQIAEQATEISQGKERIHELERRVRDLERNGDHNLEQATEISQCKEEIPELKAGASELERNADHHLAILEEGKPSEESKLKVIPTALTSNEVTTAKNLETDKMSDGKLSTVSLPQARRSFGSSLDEMKPESQKTEVSTNEEKGGKALTADDVESQIINFLQSNDILYYQLLHVPGKVKEIEIIGKGVEKLGTELSQIVDNQGYTLVIKDAELGPINDRDPSVTNWIKLCSGYSAGTFALAIADHSLSVIHAIMQGKDKKRRQSETEYFGMTTAHSFLPKDQNMTLMGSTQHFTDVLRDSIFNAYEKDFYMSVKGNADIDIVGPPRALYRYWIKNHVIGEWAVMQDIALFKLDSNQIRRHDLVASPKHDVACAEQQESVNEEGCITKILSLEDLQKFVGHRIQCAGKPGKLIRRPRICEADCYIGAHLAFVLDGGEKDWLKEGDCGSFVCLEEKDDGRVPILGMLIGQLKSNNSIHQAVILSWNIRQVEATPELKISEIKLAEASLDIEN